MKLRNVTFLAFALLGALMVLPGLNPAALQVTPPATGLVTITVGPSLTAPATLIVTVPVTGLATTTPIASVSATVPVTIPATLPATGTATLPVTASATVPSTMPATVSGTPAATVTVTAAIVATTAPPSTVAPGTPAPPPASYLRASNASPDIGSLDFYVNGQILFGGVKPGDNATFTKLAPGSYTVDLRVAGSAITSAPINTTNLIMVNGASADLGALGSKASTTEPFQLGVYVIDRSPTKGRTRVQVIHAAPGVGSIDVLQDNKPVLTQIAFSKIGNSPLNLDPGTYHFAFAPTGKLTPVAIDLPNTVLQADTIYTFILTSQQPGKPAPSAQILTSSPLS